MALPRRAVARWYHVNAVCLATAMRVINAVPRSRASPPGTYFGL
jgi:hypothetical protein